MTLPVIISVLEVVSNIYILSIVMLRTLGCNEAVLSDNEGLVPLVSWGLMR